MSVWAVAAAATPNASRNDRRDCQWWLRRRLPTWSASTPQVDAKTRPGQPPRRRRAPPCQYLSCTNASPSAPAIASAWACTGVRWRSTRPRRVGSHIAASTANSTIAVQMLLVALSLTDVLLASQPTGDRRAVAVDGHTDSRPGSGVRSGAPAGTGRQTPNRCVVPKARRQRRWAARSASASKVGDGQCHVMGLHQEPVVIRPLARAMTPEFAEQTGWVGRDVCRCQRRGWPAPPLSG